MNLPVYFYLVKLNKKYILVVLPNDNLLSALMCSIKFPVHLNISFALTVVLLFRLHRVALIFFSFL